jgi:hypothetical protein
VRKVLLEPALSFVFVGGPEDDLTPFRQYRTLQSSLSDLKSVLATASLFVGNDSGPAHMAAAFGVPSVVLFGPSDSAIWINLAYIRRRTQSIDAAVDTLQRAFDANPQDALAHYLFSRGLKVTSRDIEQLVQGVIKEKQKNRPADQPVVNLIDALINEEILRFTSLDGIANGLLPAISSAAISARVAYRTRCFRLG